MELSAEDRKRFLDKLIGDSRAVENLVDEVLFPSLVDLAQAVIVEEGLERCEWCDDWDDCLEETGDGQRLCELCYDEWREENEEDEEDEEGA